MRTLIRRARATDASAADLVFASAAREFSWLAGSPERARASLRRLWPCVGHSASYEFAWIAEVDDRLAGVAIGFPAAARYRLHAGLLRRAAGDLGVGRRLILPLGLAWLAGAAPRPPPASFYLSTLAVAPRFFRLGVASAFGDPVGDHARRLGCSHLACHTGTGHSPARKALERYGFRPSRERPAGYVLYLMELGP